jgi:hypothetical protein
MAADLDILCIAPFAGAYRGRQLERRMVTHAYFNPETHAGITRAMCGYDPGDVDPYAGERLSETVLPTCPACLEKLQRHVEGKKVRFPKGGGP